MPMLLPVSEQREPLVLESLAQSVFQADQAEENWVATARARTKRRSGRRGKRVEEGKLFFGGETRPFPNLKTQEAVAARVERGRGLVQRDFSATPAVSV